MRKNIGNWSWNGICSRMRYTLQLHVKTVISRRLYTYKFQPRKTYVFWCALACLEWSFSAIRKSCGSYRCLGTSELCQKTHFDSIFRRLAVRFHTLKLLTITKDISIQTDSWLGRCLGRSRELRHGLGAGLYGFLTKNNLARNHLRMAQNGPQQASQSVRESF